MHEDYNLISKLIKKQSKINNSSLYYLDKIYWLIEDCKKYGTLPFAGLARCGFIATEILNSFVEEKILSNDEKIHFLSSIKTITTEMNEDLKKNKFYFLKKYGHLRPGTYEITSLNYRQNFKNYFGKIDNKKTFNKSADFYFSKIQKKKLINLLRILKYIKILMS